MGYLIVLFLSYFLGTVNPAYFIARFRGFDLTKNGSGNLGASNATVTMGWRVGVFVAVFDILKAAVSVLLAQCFFPELGSIGLIAGISAVMGHMFPFYLRFRGGKGFASYLGMTAALNWKLALAVVLLALVVTVLTDYIALGTISVVTAVPAWLYYSQRSLLILSILAAAAAVIVFKHRDNIKRMLAHKEIGLRSTIRGENRVK